MAQQCVFCGYAFGPSELLDLDFLLKHTAQCVSDVCKRDNRECYCLCSSCSNDDNIKQRYASAITSSIDFLLSFFGLQQFIC